MKKNQLIVNVIGATIAVSVAAAIVSTLLVPVLLVLLAFKYLF